MVKGDRFPLRVFVERNNNQQFKSRSDTPHRTPPCRNCENNWRRIMSDVLKLLLSKIPFMPKQLFLWVQIHQMCWRQWCNSSRPKLPQKPQTTLPWRQRRKRMMMKKQWTNWHGNCNQKEHALMMMMVMLMKWSQKLIIGMWVTGYKQWMDHTNLWSSYGLKRGNDQLSHRGLPPRGSEVSTTRHGASRRPSYTWCGGEKDSGCG